MRRYPRRPKGHLGIRQAECLCSFCLEMTEPLLILAFPASARFVYAREGQRRALSLFSLGHCSGSMWSEEGASSPPAKGLLKGLLVLV